MIDSSSEINSKTLCIACGVFRSDLKEILKDGRRNIDVEYLPGGLHREPKRLKLEVQKSIDEAASIYGRIIVLYGLCGQGIVGIKSGSRTLVLPKAHDCISLFLGGTEEYRKQFSHAPGTYYISAGWYEEQIQPKGVKVRYPEEYVDTENPEELERRFGEENARNITDFLDSWKKNYSRAVYIDSGSDDEAKYEAHAKALAAENDWEYEKLSGSRKMILHSLDAVESDDLALVVPPGHELYHDTGTGTVNSAPLGDSASLDKNIAYTIKAPGHSEKLSKLPHRIGLGIDAGGTYTDAVIYDFLDSHVLAKSKALTTKWKYSEGIMKAVESLPEELKRVVDLISVSTTLVTNAIVESNSRPVGLLLMPNGTETPSDLKHQPLTMIRGRTTIGGDITEDVDPEEIRSAVQKMISHFHVEAFAVSGYGGSVNPALELKVKKIIREETDFEVCCGHELSGSLNFSVRATTAVLNAGVMPIMEDFLKEMSFSVSEAGLKAPILVVRGDGAVMSESYARDFPVQTALSGPAASMAGAMFLTGIRNAAVVDVGGTTSDIGFLDDGLVGICDDGARIGKWDTHVKAVDMLTSGLGGDSEILFERQDWVLGPRRVTPVSWLGTMEDSTRGIKESLRDAGSRPADWIDSTATLQFLYRTSKIPDFELTSREQAVYDALESGPLMMWQIKDRIGAGSWRLVKSGRLENAYCIQRSGLTPTDLFHSETVLNLWDAGLANEYLSLIAGVAGITISDLGIKIRTMISGKLGSCLLQKLLGQEIAQGNAIKSILKHGNEKINLSPRISIPVIGLGAPASLMMNDVMKDLDGNLTLCEHGDVANAIGAITSKVTTTRDATVAATSSGGFRVHGIEGENRHFESLDEAENRCIQALVDQARKEGRKAGSSADEVSMTIKTDVARTVEGSELFIERRYRAVITGAPDLV